MIKVISGGQNGVDQAGLEAAKRCGIKTGGTMPKGFWTLDGARPEVAQRYGLVENNIMGYKNRTWKNVENSNVTIRFARNFESPGEWCTLNAIRTYRKPYLDVPEATFISNPKTANMVLIDTADWLKGHLKRNNGNLTINIAGNSEKSSPGIYNISLNFFERLFYEIFAD